jgi:hypothetical protein
MTSRQPEDPTPRGGRPSPARIRVNEHNWPPGSSARVRRFLAEVYDPEQMPPLILSRHADGTLWLLGWDVETDARRWQDWETLLDHLGIEEPVQ